MRWWSRLLDPVRYLGGLERGARTRLVRLNQEGESFLGAASAIALAIALQYALPTRVSQHVRWLFPTVAVVLLVALIVGHGRRIDHQSPRLRSLVLLTIVIMAVANGIAAVRLIRDLLEDQGLKSPSTLLFTGGAIWLTNVIVFALVFWMFDRGGPAARFLVKGTERDLLFPQQAREEGPGLWEATFFDYFYTSFTAATAFSPTDVMPLSRWAKAAMMLESAMSLLLAIVVVARAINLLG